MNKFKCVTQKDIAIALGLSVSTVSRVLSDVYGIGDDTRKLVMDYAKKIGYYPNPIAQKLKGGRSYSIGVLVSELSNNYFAQIIDGIESVAHDKGYHIVISQTHDDAIREQSALQLLTNQPIDGILMSLSAGTKDAQYLDYLKEKEIPAVFFDRVPRDPSVNRVVVDNYHAAYQATQHLIESGFTQIAHLTNAKSLLNSEERLAGYQAALNDHHLPYSDDLVAYCDAGGKNVAEVAVAIRKWQILKRPPQAIFCAGDELTLTCLHVLRQMGLKVPTDLALLGFTNTLDGDLYHSPLSTISQPAFQIGKQSALLLIKEIEGKNETPQTIVLDTTFTIRESSGSMAFT